MIGYLLVKYILSRRAVKLHESNVIQAPEKLSDGRWAFKSDNGYYLSRCNNCVPFGRYPDFAFTHSPHVEENPWAEWIV